MLAAVIRAVVVETIEETVILVFVNVEVEAVLVTTAAVEVVLVVLVSIISWLTCKVCED